MTTQTNLTKARTAFNNYEPDTTSIYWRELYKALLDDCYPRVDIAGSTFYPSQIVEKCDQTMFACGLNDYIDAVYYSESSKYREHHKLDPAWLELFEDYETALLEAIEQNESVEELANELDELRRQN